MNESLMKLVSTTPVSKDNGETSMAFNQTTEDIKKIIEPSLDDIPIPPEEDDFDMFEEVMRKKQEQLVNEANQNSINDLDVLTFSTVSSVATIDLSDFENSIKLSDDEASIVGKPKNSKVPIKEIQGQINDLQTTTTTNTSAANEAATQMQNDTVPNEAGVLDTNTESDGACSEGTTTGRRVSRTRKQNSRYNNEHFIVSK